MPWLRRRANIPGWVSITVLQSAVAKLTPVSERDFEDEKGDKDGKDGEASGSKSDEPEKTPDSQLALEVQTLCKMMFSTKLMDATLSSMNYDANKLPLGKLAKNTILNGFAALKVCANFTS